MDSRRELWNYGVFGVEVDGCDGSLCVQQREASIEGVALLIAYDAMLRSRVIPIVIPSQFGAVASKMASDFSALIADDRSSPDTLCRGVTKVAAHVTNGGRRYGACSSVSELGVYRRTNR
jgi:hypothetical protein